MKALSIKQPYATLIAKEIKDVENRTWKTNFRGKIYIHSSKQEVKEHWGILKDKQYEIVKSLVLENKLDYYFPELPFGAIIGEVEIVDCVINHPSIWAEKTGTDFGSYCHENKCDEFIEWEYNEFKCESCELVGQSYHVDTIPKDCLFKNKMPKPIYNWVLENPILYDKPIPNIKGKLSLWEFDDGDLSHLMSIMRLNKSGYAGINKQGQIVDRREFPDAVPVGKNSIFGVAEPKDL